MDYIIHPSPNGRTLLNQVGKVGMQRNDMSIATRSSAYPRYALALLLAVNLGDDADTTGAIYGQLAGAYYGAAAIPIEWREILAKRELIEAYADRLRELAT